MEHELDGGFGTFVLAVLLAYLLGAFLLALVVHLFVTGRWWTVAVSAAVLPSAFWVALTYAMEADNGRLLDWITGFAHTVAWGGALGLIGAIPGAMAGAAIRRRLLGHAKA